MADEAEVANIALLELGSEPIANLQLATAGNGRYIAARFNIARDLVLKSYPWNFAKRRAILAATASTVGPNFDWGYAYNLPADPYCLRVLEIGGKQAKEVEHEISGRQLLTNLAGPLKIKFIARITDASLWDPFFCQALGLHLGHSTAYKITSSVAIEQSLRKKALDFLRLGQSIDGQEGTPDIDEDEGEILGARD